ncbi:hypothetical protein Tco_0886234 [Tanacetum coccineum]
MKESSEKAPQVPVKYWVENWFVRVPRNSSQWLCPQLRLNMLLLLGVVQSIVVSYDPFPSTDETEQRPLREFLIKFSILNGQRPLILDFNTFCSSTGLDYNNGIYVAHPTPEAVLGGNYSFIEQVNSIQQLLAYCLITGIEIDIGEIIYSDLKDSVSPLPLAVNPKKRKSQTVTPTLPKLYGPKVLGALSKKSKRPKSKKPPTETKVTLPKPTEGSEQSYSVSSGTVPDP